jgi:hypothetical protein
MDYLQAVRTFVTFLQCNHIARRPLDNLPDNSKRLFACEVWPIADADHTLCRKSPLNSTYSFSNNSIDCIFVGNARIYRVHQRLISQLVVGGEWSRAHFFEPRAKTNNHSMGELTQDVVKLWRASELCTWLRSDGGVDATQLFIRHSDYLNGKVRTYLG